MKDYYQILEIVDTAGAEEIKRAYRRLAKQHHPDVNGSKKSNQHFLEVREAVDTLLDPAKKIAYDLRRKGDIYHELYQNLYKPKKSGPEAAAQAYREKYKDFDTDKYSRGKQEAFHNTSFGKKMHVFTQILFAFMVLSGILFSILPFASILRRTISISAGIEMTIFCEALAFACIVQGVVGYNSHRKISQERRKKS